MKLFILSVPEVGDPVRKEFTCLNKAIKFFCTETRKVKRKQLWGVKLYWVYDDGSLWLMSDCYQCPIKCRGLEDLPKTNLLLLKKKRTGKQRDSGAKV